MNQQDDKLSGLCTRGRRVAGVAFSSVDQSRSLGYGERGSLINIRYLNTYLGTLEDPQRMERDGLCYLDKSTFLLRDMVFSSQVNNPSHRLRTKENIPNHG